MSLTKKIENKKEMMYIVDDTFFIISISEILLKLYNLTMDKVNIRNFVSSIMPIIGASIGVLLNNVDIKELMMSKIK